MYREHSMEMPPMTSTLERLRMLPLQLFFFVMAQLVAMVNTVRTNKKGEITLGFIVVIAVVLIAATALFLYGDKVVAYIGRVISQVDAFRVS